MKEKDPTIQYENKVQARVGILEWGSKFFGIKLNDSAGEPDEQGPTTEKPSEEKLL